METFCRTCTSSTEGQNVNIFGSSIFKQLIICTSLDCDESDQYPNVICQKCSQKLNEFYEFRMMCVNSINTFNSMLKEDPNALQPKQQFLEPVVTKTEVFECENQEEEDDFFNDYVAIEEDFDEKNPLTLRESEDDEEETEDVEFTVHGEEEEEDTKEGILASGERKRKYYECPTCAKKFVKEERLGNHMRIHEGLKPFPCNQCHRSYMKLANLNTHIKESHRLNGEKLVIPCTAENCDKTFDKRHSLLAHLRYKHSNKVRPERTYICETCGKTFKTSWSLKEHMYHHSGEKTYPYKCDQCSKRFIAQKAFKEHLLRHSGIKNFECSYCGMKKTTARELRTHLNYHTKEKQWPCPLCPSIFNAKGNLKLHNDRVHLGIKNYNCQYCDQSFSKSETLKHHEMTHTGEKPHGCEICGKRFIQAIALKTHMKTHNK